MKNMLRALVVTAVLALATQSRTSVAEACSAVDCVHQFNQCVNDFHQNVDACFAAFQICQSLCPDPVT